MKRIETSIVIWAARNPVWAKVLIGLLLILLTFLGLAIGKLLQSLGIVTGKLMTYLAVAVMLAGILIYPSKELLRQERMFLEKVYKRQKTAHLILMLGFLLFLITMPAQFSHFRQDKYVLKQSFAIEYQKKTDLYQQQEKSSVSQLYFLKLRRPNEAKSGVIGKVFVLLLLLIFAVAIGFVIAAAACLSSCGGSQAALVAIIIVAGIVELLVVYLIIRQIVKIFKSLTRKKSAMERLSH